MIDKSSLLTRLAERRPTKIDLGLDRMFAALGALGNPHHAMPPVFHVAGTNGKGSTVAFLRAMLEAADYRVHTYTSPHLVRFNERIVLAGEEISDPDLIDAILACEEAAADLTLTYFEAITCAAFVAFSRQPADFLLLEVGLGGRLDATNVIDKPLASLITPVALDHQEYLGRDIATIAAEKAGIAREGVPLVIGPQTPAAMASIEDRALAVGAQSFKFGEEWQTFEEQGRLIYQDTDGLCDLEAPRLAGHHQFTNAGLAIAALRCAGVSSADKTLSKGVVSAHWPARMQQLRYGPMVTELQNLTGEAADLWLDGGHNPHAARALARILADLDERVSRPVAVICGMQSNKDINGYFEALSGLVRRVYATGADHRSSAAKGEVIAEAAMANGHDAVAMTSLDEAWASLTRDIEDGFFGDGVTPRILIAGSLYLAGDVLETHG